MPSLLRLPAVASDTSEATLVSWSVEENVPYAARDTIASVETAKAVVDVEAESDGVILKTLVVGGTEVKVGEPIAVVGLPGERMGDLDSVLVQLGVRPPIVKGGPAERAVETVAAPPTGESPSAGPADLGTRIFISPLARRLARDAGVDIAEIRGSGPGQRIVRRDVEGAIAQRRSGAPDSASAGIRELPSSSAPTGDLHRKPGITAEAAEVVARPFRDTPHSRQRRLIAARLTQSTQTAPHFYLSGAPRVDRLLRMRGRLNESADLRVSVNDLVVKAVARAHELVPAMNVIWTPDAIRSFASVDVGIAIATESGLLTPVIRDAASMRVTRIAALTRDFADRARAGRLQQHELEGGSVTVTNLGMFGTVDFAAIINPPQSAILAVGAAIERPIVHNGKLTVGTVMQVTLSVDHRPVDGASAAQWMREFVALVEDPIRILA